MKKLTAAKSAAATIKRDLARASKLTVQDWLAMADLCESLKAFALDAARTHSEGPQLWVWNWTSGGYNSCSAETREEALKKAHRKSSKLNVDPKTLRPCTASELAEIDRHYSGMFD